MHSISLSLLLLIGSIGVSQARSVAVAESDCPRGCNCDYGAPECYYVKIDERTKTILLRREIRSGDLPGLIQELKDIQSKAK